MKNIISRLSNTKTIMAIVSAIVLILTTNGVKVDNEAIMITVQSVCSILVLLGIMNDKGMSTTKWNDKDGDQ